MQKCNVLEKVWTPPVRYVQWERLEVGDPVRSQILNEKIEKLQVVQMVQETPQMIFEEVRMIEDVLQSAQNNGEDDDHPMGGYPPLWDLWS